MQQDLKKCTVLTEKQARSLENNFPNFEDLELMSRLFDVFSDVGRMKILCALSICDMCVSDLCSILKENQTTISHRLAVLKNFGVVRSEREGKIIVYKIKNKRIFNLFLEAVETIQEN